MRITASKHYLTIPIWQNKCDLHDLRLLTIECADRFIYRFLLPIRSNMPGIAPEGTPVTQPDYQASIDISSYMGQELVIGGEMPDAYLSMIAESDEIVQPPVQTERPAFHYTAPYGWINDPNGMVYADGVYHLYYQHNPMNTEWANMSWGHATSTDLVHYEFQGDVMCPDEHGTIFSGCGIQNDHGCFGLPKDALLFFYTAARDSTRLGAKVPTQRMAYSLDGGTTLIKYPDWELECLAEENRDPKVYWAEEFGCYIITLYMVGNQYGIFRSTDLENWELAQTLDIPPMWECPDLFRLTSEDGRHAWAFTSADGYYVLGEFDGYTFTATTDVLSMYGGATREDCKTGKLPYAAQSYAGTGDRVITIAWLRIPNRGTCYTGAMSLPRELTLDEDENGPYIRQRFVSEAAEYIEEDDLGMHAEDAYIQESISDDGRFYTAEIMN